VGNYKLSRRFIQVFTADAIEPIPHSIDLYLSWFCSEQGLLNPLLWPCKAPGLQRGCV